MKTAVRFFIIFFFCSLFLTSLGSHIAHAHEVYVLDENEINFALQAPSPDFISTIKDHLQQFLTWGLLVIAIITIVFFISINTVVERLIDPYLNILKLAAPYIAQTTLGAALLASGYYHAIFGVELPLLAIFGPLTGVVSVMLELIGVMLLLGIFPRIAALLTIIFFIFLTWEYGVYVLNYLTYAGEAITLFLFGSAYTLFKNRSLNTWLTEHIPGYLYKYKFLTIRIFFGVSLIYASLYAKFIHGALALETVSKYHLTNYFPFDPVFLVLGAMLIEVLLGLFFFFGFEIRFASIFFLVFLTMSLVFFGEAVWPHIILIGTALAMFSHGYDRYCLSAILSKKKNLEPVL